MHFKTHPIKKIQAAMLVMTKNILGIPSKQWLKVIATSFMTSRIQTLSWVYLSTWFHPYISLSKTDLDFYENNPLSYFLFHFVRKRHRTNACTESLVPAVYFFLHKTFIYSFGWKYLHLFNFARMWPFLIRRSKIYIVTLDWCVNL